MPDGSNSVSDMQDYFDYIFKKHVMIDKPPIRIYVNKIENMTTLRTKTGYHVQLLCMKRWNYLKVLKVRQLKMKMVKMCLS